MVTRRRAGGTEAGASGRQARIGRREKPRNLRRGAVGSRRWRDCPRRPGSLPYDDVDRGNLLGAAVATCERHDRDLAEIVEGADRADEALAAGRRTGLLILPAFDQVMAVTARAAGLLQRARDEGWRLLLLDLGADSQAPQRRRRWCGSSRAWPRPAAPT